MRFSGRDNNPNTQGTEQRKYRILSLFLENGSGQKGMEEEEENFLMTYLGHQEYRASSLEEWE